MQEALLNPDDKRYLETKGIQLVGVDTQVKAMLMGMQFTQLNRPCLLGDGILLLDDQKRNQFRDYFRSRQSSLELISFVPASGAASRMFSHLQDADLNKNLFHEFVSNRRLLPFYKEWSDIMRRDGVDIEEDRSFTSDMVAKTLLSDSGLNFRQLPKGAIPFHSYGDKNRTPFEEHLCEASLFCTGKTGAHVHFTVAPTFSISQRLKIRELASRIGAKNGSLTVSFSEQYNATDAVALSSEGDLLRHEDGTPVLRPGGHGALLRNLNELNGDLIFIKNIDNILPDRLKEEVGLNKQLLGGLAQFLTEERNRLYNRLLENDEAAKEEAISYIHEWFNIRAEREQTSLLHLLNRPIRVCGMVKNVGEPGGGPFWVEGSDHVLRVQIVEKAQVNLESDHQKAVFENSTHFNPVDIVCSIKKPQGGVFDLSEFIDSQAAFISSKTHGKEQIKVYEHPGLWNGAMAYWNSVFVEVPLETFAPVKTVNDLLKPYHQ